MRRTLGRFFKKHKPKFLISLLTYGLVLGGLEIGARIFLGPAGSAHRIYDSFFPEHGNYVEDKDLFWKLPPHLDGEWMGVRVHSNAFGLRDTDFERQKPPGVYRILLLGESGAHGQGVAFENIFSERLEALLNRTARPGRRYEVINAAHPSYTSFQGLTYLKKEGLSFDPDMIMTYFLTNDSFPSYFVVSPSTKTDWTAIFDHRLTGPGLTDRELYERRRKYYELERVLNKSAFYQNFVGLALRLKYYVHYRLNKDQARRKGDVEKVMRKTRVPEEDRRWVYNQFVAIANERKIQLLILTPPYTYTHGPHSRHFDWIVPTDNVHFLHLGDVFRRLPYKHGELFIDEVHPGVRGHRIIAEKIHEFLKEQGV